MKYSFFLICCCGFASILITSSSCSSNGYDKEQIAVPQPADDLVDTVNSIRKNTSLTQLKTSPGSVVLTGMGSHRLITIYRAGFEGEAGTYYHEGKYDEPYTSEAFEHYMPGLDLIQGYNLVNMAHHDMAKGKMDYFFDRTVIIKSVYYPSFYQDSLYEKPVSRDYYLLSVYDTDTDADTLITRKDFRKIFYFNTSLTEKIQLIPNEYSVKRSQYDPKNDVMYVFAKFDENKNGKEEKSEPQHIFWVDLKNPKTARRLY